MNANLILLINAAAVSISVLLVVIVYGLPVARSWIAVHSIIIITAAAAYTGQWSYAGYAIFAASMVLVVAPGVATALAARAFYKGKYARAAYLSAVAAWLHPTRLTRFSARRAKAEALPSLAMQCAALDNFARSAEPGYREMFLLQAMRLRNDWQGILDLPVDRIDPSFAELSLTYRIQALGQTGQLNEMVSLFRANRAIFDSSPSGDQALLPIFTFCGRFDIVDRMLVTGLYSTLSDHARHWTSALARLVAGQAEARAVLEALAADEPDPDRRILLEERLKAPLADPALILSPKSAALVDELAARKLRRIQATPQRARRYPPATLFLILAILFAYGVEMAWGNPENLQVLFELGGMWPPSVTHGEWWRLGTSIFLHAGPIHLVLNLVMLFLLGQIVEQLHGSWRLLAIYILGGFLSSLAVFGLMHAKIIHLALLVGASGAIFALFGAIAADVLKRWFTNREADDLRRIGVLAGALVLQAGFDYLIPNLSAAAHISGFLIGALIGFGLIALKRQAELDH